MDQRVNASVLLRKARRRRASMMLEFAVISVLLYGFLAATLTFGLLYFNHQAVQTAADLAAREISQTPLPAGISFEDALQHPRVKERIFDEDFLVLDITDWASGNSGLGLYQYIDQVIDPPMVNKALYPVMIRHDFNGRSFLRYPGALVESSTAPSGFTVVAPIVVGRGADGAEEVYLARVLQPIAGAPIVPGDPLVDAFPITSPQRGIVALQLNLPYSSTTLVGGFDNTRSSRFLADDAAVSVVGGSLPPGGVGLFDPFGSDDGHPYAGLYGLGRMFSQGAVRPYRHMVTTRSIHRREVFE